MSDTTNFSDEALALIVWLQHGIGHESLRVAIDWPGKEREKRGRKPTRTVIPKMTEDELEAALAERGVSLPIDPIGQTDIGDLFEEYGTATEMASDPTEARTPSDQPEEKREVNDTAPFPTTRERGDSE